MKKLLSLLILAVLLLAGPSALAQEAALSADLTRGLPIGWLATAEYGGSIENETREGNAALSLRGSGEMPVMNLTTAPLNLAGAQEVAASISFSTASSGAVEATRYFRLAWGAMQEGTAEPPTSQNLVLASIDGANQLTMGSGSAALEENRIYQMSLALKISEGAVAYRAYLDGQPLAEGTLTSRYIGPQSLSALRLNVHCSYWTMDTAQYADFDLYDLTLTGEEEIQISSDPENGNEMAVLQDGSISVNFNTVLSGPPQTITLEKGAQQDGPWESAEYAFRFLGSGVKLVPETVEENTWYRVLLQNMTSLSGEQLEESEICFKTAIAGYQPPQVTLSGISDGEHFRQNVPVTLQASVQSAQSIEKIEYFANGISIGSGESIEWTTPREAGSYLIEARATDELGGVGRAQITVIVEENMLPQITFVGLSDYMIKNLEDLTQVQVDVSDPDGTVEKLEVFLNDTLVGQGQGGGTFALEPKTLGTTVIRARATDNEGGVSEKSVTVIVTANDQPYITSVTGMSNEHPVQLANRVRVTFSGAWTGLEGSSLLERTQVTCETGEVEVVSFESASGSQNTYLLTFQESLDSGCNYVISIATSPQEDALRTIGTFSTVYADFDVTDYLFTSGEQLSFEATIKNDEDAQRTVYVVLVTMDESGRLQDNAVEEITVLSGESKKVSVSAPEAEDAIAYLVDGPQNGKGVINRIFHMN